MKRIRNAGAGFGLKDKVNVLFYLLNEYLKNN